MVPELKVVSPDGSTRMVRLDRDKLSLGRASTNDLCFPEDSGLSRQHLVFERDGVEWVVKDLGSKNGTVVNGVRIPGFHRLRPGDRISAGHIVIEYQSLSATLQTVVFVEGAESETPADSTVVTNLAGLLETPTGEHSAAPRPALEGPRQVHALLRAGRELAGHQPLEELFKIIMDLSIEAVGAARGVLMTLDGDRLTVRAARGEGFAISAAVRDKVLRERVSLLVKDTQLDEAFKSRASIVQQRVRSMMAVPLQTMDRVIGLIYVDAPNYVRPFTPEDLNLLTVMANVAAIRIEHARLAEVEQAERILSRELEQAAEIQRRLLPREVTPPPGLDLAGYNAACRWVGGDYYDFFPYPNDRMAVAIGDVAGKGMPAALLMSSLQARVQTLVEESLMPAELVTRLNRQMAMNCPDNRFITFFFGVLNPVSGELVHCNAGHNPPLVVRPGGKVERIEGGGVVMGLLPTAPYYEAVCYLDREDTVVLYSDGVTEATPPDSTEEFGEERLSAVLAQLHGQPAQAVLDAVIQAVTSWCAGAPAADDITLVAARRTG